MPHAASPDSFRLPPEAAAALGERLTALTQTRGGSALVATGPRTAPAAAEALRAAIDGPSFMSVWGEGGANPFEALLALGDEIVVTIDSVSMAHEASLTGRPLHIAPLPPRGTRLRRMALALESRLRRGRIGDTYEHLLRGGWLYPPRRVEQFQAALVEAGRAVWLGDTPRAPSPEPPADDLPHALAAVRRLACARLSGRG